MLVVDPKRRLSAEEALNHPWIANSDDDYLMGIDLGENLIELRRFNAKRKLRQAVMSVIAVKKVTWFAYHNFYQGHHDDPVDISRFHE